ncbi:dicarboxylate/amino acid:cation symporter, partial [Akkermansiaceae bacterium]|nr:dicarboxylate/amino acid:cation symporter [Akkermansiaceae bacterium]
MKLAPHWQILISLALAVLLGLFIKTMGLQDTTFFSWVIEISGLVGKLFMNLLKMIIVPLVVSSVIAGIASLHGVKGFGRLLGKTSGFYAMSSFLAIILGLSLVNLIQPGLVDGQPNAVVKEAFDSYEPDSSELAKIDQAKVNSEEQSGSYAQLSGFFLRMVPPNIFEAATQNGQMLGLIFFSLCFALAMTRLEKEKMTTLRDVFISFNDVMIVMTNYIMKLAPIGVFGLLVPVMVQTGGDLFAALAKYFVTVLLALGLHMFVVMPILIRVLGGINPLAHFRAMRTALMTAFSTASSSATLPVTMRCIQEKAGVSKGTASFTLPLGATVNMDGTALYECVAVIFVAQVMGIEMTFAAQFMVVAAALLTSVGVAGIPSASLVAIFVILKNSGIPGAETAVVALLS